MNHFVFLLSIRRYLGCGLDASGMKQIHNGRREGVKSIQSSIYCLDIYQILQHRNRIYDKSKSHNTRVLIIHFLKKSKYEFY